MDTRWKPSVTVAAVIAKRFDGIEKFLLVEEETRDGLRLNNPAGHLDPGESPEQGCARETLEETAFHFKPTAVVGVYMSRFERVQTNGVLDITYLRFAYCGELGAHVEGQPLDKASCAPCGSPPTKSGPAWTGTAARCCCAAWKTTWPAAAIRWAW